MQETRKNYSAVLAAEPERTHGRTDARTDAQEWIYRFLPEVKTSGEPITKIRNIPSTDWKKMAENLQILAKHGQKDENENFRQKSETSQILSFMDAQLHARNLKKL